MVVNLPTSLDRFSIALFDLIDLTQPSMATVKPKVDAGDLTGAMIEYRAVLAARLAKLPKWTRYGYSLWQPANADELLNGDATTARYGDESVHYTVHIGKPGEINFFARHPEYPVDHAPLDAGGLRADAGSLLVVRDKDGRLTGVALDAKTFDDKPAGMVDFEFDLAAPGQPAKITAITMPTGFRWAGQGKQLVPEYVPPTP